MGFYNAAASATGYIFQGDDLNEGANAPNAQLAYIDSSYQANLTFLDNINVQANPSNGTTYIINDDTSGIVTFNSLNFTNDLDNMGNPSGPTAANQNIDVLGAAGSTTVLGAISNNTAPGYSVGTAIVFNENGGAAGSNLIINGPLTFSRTGNKEIDFAAGNIYLATSSTGTGDISFVGQGNNGPVMAVLTQGAQTIVNNLYAQSQANMEIGGSTANASTFNGTVTAGADSYLALNAAAGGTVTFNGNIGGDVGMVEKTGDGTVILNQASGNGYDVDNRNVYGFPTAVTTTDAFEMKAGTTLIQNTSGSAFGVGSNQAGTPTYAQIDAGATLGGSGISIQQIVAMAHSSTLAPGNGTSINTLHLNGGLTTTALNGLTMKFDLNGTANDSIDFASAAVVLNGAIDVSFANLGSVLTDHVYTLLTGTGDWTGGTPIFAITAPAGYVLDASYGTGGYEYVTTGGTDSFSVEFSTAPIPEPSPILLISVSIAGLAFLRWARRLNALNT